MNANMRKILRNIFFAPFNIMTGSLEDIDHEELARIVSKRLSRAENAVLRDYAAQHGLEGEEAEAVAEEYRRRKAESAPDQSVLRQLRDAVRAAEKRADRAESLAAAERAMDELGVLGHHRADVLTLAEKDASSADGGSIAEALASVVERMPFVTGDGGMNSVRTSSGSAGNFPRPNGAEVLQQELNTARGAGDNAAAVAIISEAARRGISLR